MQPTLVYPPMNSVNIPIDVTLAWHQASEQPAFYKPDRFSSESNTKKNVGLRLNSLSAATYFYWLELTTDTTQPANVIQETSIMDTAKSVSSLKNSTDYWWRVKAMNSIGWGQFSSWSKFTTIINLPGATTLLTPNSTSRIPDTARSIIFSWMKTPYAGTYDFQISNDNKFSTLLLDTTGVTDTVFVCLAKNLGPAFCWRARGVNIAGAGTWPAGIQVSLISGINSNNNSMPVVYKLLQNYPNPFNPATAIRYALPKTSYVKIKIFNLIGQAFEPLINEIQSAGYHEAIWNASNIASGIYLCKFEAVSLDGKESFHSAKKLILLK